MSHLLQHRLDVPTRGRGLHPITPAVRDVVRRAPIGTGLCQVFVQHTSCSLVIQENADPTARHDLEGWMERLAPEGDPAYTHTLEGEDDMPAHLRSAITNTSEHIPIVDGDLGLGTWQGLYLWEHRRRGSVRRLVVTLLGAACVLAFSGCSEDPVAEVDSGPAFEFDFGGVGATGDQDILQGAPEGTCCDDDVDCALGLICVIEPAAGERGECLPPPEGDSCYQSADCANGGGCVGPILCGCENDCSSEAGVCDTSCCTGDGDCAPDQLCLDVGEETACNLRPGTGCWTDLDCAEGTCEGARPCSCGGPCDDTFGPGRCEVDRRQTGCSSDDECPSGSCMAGSTCTDACPPGDPSCCTDSQCVPFSNGCSKDSDCGSTGQCSAGPLCYDWCADSDPSCCFGNFCSEIPCAGASPAGCFETGCAAGEACVVDETCIPTSCSCAPEGWICSDDCVGGQCLPSACPGKNPQGCMDTGCPEGLECVVDAQCTPSSCSCDEQGATWVCSADCGGGRCL